MTTAYRVMDSPRWKLIKNILKMCSYVSKKSSWISEGISIGQGHKPKRYVWNQSIKNRMRFPTIPNSWPHVGHNFVHTPAPGRLYPPKNDAPVFSTSLGRSVWNLRWSEVAYCSTRTRILNEISGHQFYRVLIWLEMTLLGFGEARKRRSRVNRREAAFSVIGDREITRHAWLIF